MQLSRVIEAVEYVLAANRQPRRVIECALYSGTPSAAGDWASFVLSGPASLPLTALEQISLLTGARSVTCDRNRLELTYAPKKETLEIAD